MQIISASIDLSKIDKTRIQKTDKDGNPYKNGAMYYSVDIVIKDEVGQYGNIASISTAQTKEERQDKKPKVFIGNGKQVWTNNVQKSEPQQSNSNSANDEDLLPF